MFSSDHHEGFSFVSSPIGEELDETSFSLENLVDSHPIGEFVFTTEGYISGVKIEVPLFQFGSMALTFSSTFSGTTYGIQTPPTTANVPLVPVVAPLNLFIPTTNVTIE